MSDFEISSQEIDPLLGQPAAASAQSEVESSATRHRPQPKKKLWWHSVWFLGCLAFVVLMAVAVVTVVWHNGALFQGSSQGPARNAGLVCANPAEEAEGKDATTALLLCIFLGAFGAHRFYYDYPEFGGLFICITTTIVVAAMALQLAGGSLFSCATPPNVKSIARFVAIQFILFLYLIAFAALWVAEIVGLSREDIVPRDSCFVPI